MKLTYCPFCLSAVQSEICPYCGNSISYTGDPMHLQVGYVLNGMHPYVLGASLGQGGFGITYIALDIVENRRVAIKEYFPTYCAGRNGDVTVASYRGQEGNFLKGKERFLDEARMLKSLSDLSGVVDVLDFFEANNSAYLVMEFLEGNSLKEHVERSGKLSAQPFLKQLKPLMSDVEKMHHRGVIHRDIAPDNIIMLPDGRLKLIDFGAARSYLGDKSMTVVVKKGFAPVEQYMRKGGNASTDVYALAATIYYCITGVIPADSAERQYGEELQAPTKLGAELSREQEQALEKALAIQPKDRTQSVAEMIKGLEKAPKPPAPPPEPKKQKPVWQKERKPLISIPQEKKEKKPLFSHSEKKQIENLGTQPGKPLLKQEKKDVLQSPTGETAAPEVKTVQEIKKPELAPEKKPVFEQKTDSAQKKQTDPISKRKWLGPVCVTVIGVLIATGVLTSGRQKPLPEELPKLQESQMAVTEAAGPHSETVPVSKEVNEVAEYDIHKTISGNTMTFSGENIAVSIVDERSVTITVSGLDIAEKYIINRATTEKNHEEYSWKVRLSDGYTTHEVRTGNWAMNPGEETVTALEDMDDYLWLISDGRGETIQPVNLAYTPDSITWEYTLDQNTVFDFDKVTEIEFTSIDMPSAQYLTRFYILKAKEPVSEETMPEVPLQEDPVPEETMNVPSGSVSEEYTATVKTSGNKVSVSGDNLQIEVIDGKNVTITVSGLNMKDQYVSNMATSKESYSEYWWGIQMSDGQETHDIATVRWADNPGTEVIVNLSDMQHSFWRTIGSQHEWVRDVAMTNTKDSITWKYIMGSLETLDFQKLSVLEVVVNDLSLGLELNRSYKIDIAAEVEKKSIQDDNQKKQSVNANVHPIFEEELSFKSNSITPVRIRDNGYSLHSAKFLDKPVNNCVSISAEITVEEGTPEGFDVYIQDIDKWRAAGRIKANGEKVITGTVSFSKAVSFNAFAIVPAGGDYQTTISYKLTGAEVKGSLLQSSWTEKDVVFSGGDLQIQVNDNREVIVTLSGLDLLDEFPSKVSGRQGTEEYQWNVYLTSGNNFLSFQTDCPVPVNKFNQPKVTVWKDMKHSAALGALAFGEADDHIIKGRKPTVTHTADSITWTFELDQNHPFDFKTGITAEINWFDRANGKSEHSFYFGR